MKTAFKPDLKSKKLCISKSYASLKNNEIVFVNNKFYQKFLVIFISFSTFLIFPESPRELENICENYNAIKLCIVW